MFLFSGSKLNELSKSSGLHEITFFYFKTHLRLKAYIPLVPFVLQQYSNISFSKMRQK